MKLGRKLAEWREADLITAEQARGILTFEAERSRSANWIVLALGAVGALAVVTGIISLVAANWEEIPPAAKLAAALAMLVGSLAAAYYFSSDEKTLASDLFLAANAGLVLAMIGLVGQVYHLSGAPWRALALAAAMAIPAALIARHSLLSDIAVGYALAALALFLRERSGRPWLDGLGWVLLGASVGAVLLLVADALEQAHPPAVRALRRWGAGLLLVVAVFAAFAWSVAWSGRTHPPMMILASCVAIASIARLAWLRKGAVALGAAALASLIVGAAAISGAFPGSWHATAATTRFAGFALFCAAGGAFAVGAARAGSRRLTNLFTLAIAARIVVLFLEVLNTLALTGFGLLLTGAVFCGVAWAWWRLHRVLPVSEAAP
jgi:uncharacterized membrane protein